MKVKAQLATVSYSVGDIEKAVAFYSTLLGVELARSLTDLFPSYHAIVSAGVQLTLNPRQGDEQVTCHFAVDNLDVAIKDLEQQGGKRVAGPFELTLARTTMDEFAETYRAFGGKEQVRTSMGAGAIVLDPDGNPVGLLQLAPFAYDAFKRGELTEEDFREHEAALKTGRLLETRP